MAKIGTQKKDLTNPKIITLNYTSCTNPSYLGEFARPETSINLTLDLTFPMHKYSLCSYVS